MIPYGSASVNETDRRAVQKVLSSKWLTQGPNVEAFESALAVYCGVKYAVALTNGTAALHLAYLVAGLKAGDEIITTPNTFVATTNMAVVLGVKPVFADIRPDTCNIDETKIEKLITKKTKAIVPVHFAGHPCNMEAIAKIAKKYKLLVIEDACHALGASSGKDKIGALKHSDLAVFSFHPVKSITTGEGGAIVTNDKKMYERFKRLRSHGIEKDVDGLNIMTELGFNYRLTDIQSALGLSQLKRIDSFVRARHKLVKEYTKLLGDIPQIILPTELTGVESSWHLYVIRVKKVKDRLPLFRYLRKQGIGVNIHYPAVYNHPFYRSFKLKPAKCPEADLYDQTAITIPLHLKLTTKEMRLVSKIIKKYFKI